MFGLSGIELAFCAVLALVVIGPKDLPRVARSVGHVLARCRRVYTDVMGGLTQLEREIELSERPPASGPAWQDYLPPEVKDLRASIKPHAGNREETAEKYRQWKQAVAKARAEHAAAEAGRTGDGDG